MRSEPAATRSAVHGLVDHLFRRESGRMVAVLVRSFGPAHLSLAEDVVQEALMQALRRWPFHGVPSRPSAWLYTVARNLALDRLRRVAAFGSKEAEIRRLLPPGNAAPTDVRYADELTDDQLRLIFLCCHPDLPRDGRVALTLKTVCGFSVPELARAFLTREATVAQRLVRAQRRIRDLRLPFEVPGPETLPARLEAVLEVLYLTFNEGYAAHAGDALVRADLCVESLRLARELAARPATGHPQVHALAALLCLQASRLPARLNSTGEMVLLEEQDRGLWDRSLIADGFEHLERAAAGRALSAYHLEAAIAAHHAGADGLASTDWGAILNLYDQLLELNPSPVVALNRAVAVARVHGPGAGLEALDAVADAPSLRDYYLLPAARGLLLAQGGDLDAAAACLRQALSRPCSEPERRFLRRKLASLPGEGP